MEEQLMLLGSAAIGGIVVFFVQYIREKMRGFHLRKKLTNILLTDLSPIKIVYKRDEEFLYHHELIFLREVLNKASWYQLKELSMEYLYKDEIINLSHLFTLIELTVYLNAYKSTAYEITSEKKLINKCIEELEKSFSTKITRLCKKARPT